MNNQTHKYNDFEDRIRYAPEGEGIERECEGEMPEKKPFEILSGQFKAFGKALNKVLKSD